MLFCRGQKIKNITEVDQKRLLLFAFLILIFMAFLAQNILNNKYILNFVFG